jgi:hypothetical protein
VKGEDDWNKNEHDINYVPWWPSSRYNPEASVWSTESKDSPRRAAPRGSANVAGLIQRRHQTWPRSAFATLRRDKGGVGKLGPVGDDGERFLAELEAVSFSSFALKALSWEVNSFLRRLESSIVCLSLAVFSRICSSLIIVAEVVGSIVFFRSSLRCRD